MSNCCKSEAFSASECFKSVDIEDYISDLSEEPIYEPTDAPTPEPTMLFGIGDELPLEFTCDPAEEEEDVWPQCKTTDVGTCILDRDCRWRDMLVPTVLVSVNLDSMKKTVPAWENASGMRRDFAATRRFRIMWFLLQVPSMSPQQHLWAKMTFLMLLIR